MQRVAGGDSYRTIGADLGISHQRVNQVVQTVRHRGHVEVDADCPLCVVYTGIIFTAVATHVCPTGYVHVCPDYNGAAVVRVASGRVTVLAEPEDADAL